MLWGTRESHSLSRSAATVNDFHFHTDELDYAWINYESMNERRKKKSRIRWITMIESQQQKIPGTTSLIHQRTKEILEFPKCSLPSMAATYDTLIEPAMKLTFLCVPITILARVSHKINRNISQTSAKCKRQWIWAKIVANEMTESATKATLAGQECRTAR